MKKKILFGLAVFSFLLGSFSTATYAEETGSTATVTFEAGDSEPTTPVDPDNPDNPGTGPGTEMDGPLSIDYVPTLDFGSNKITGNVEAYEVENLKPYLQVSDKRGSGSGWNISVKLSAFTSDDAASTFDASLSFTNPDTLTTTSNTSAAPTTPTMVNVTSNATETTIFDAASGTGLGTWITRWYAVSPSEPTKNDAIVLTVDTANVLAKSYSADLTWMISNAP